MNQRSVIDYFVVVKRCEKVLTGEEQFNELCEGYLIQIRQGNKLAINK